MNQAPADGLGLAGTYPRPGWVVIDAVRDTGFTGEVVFATTPAVAIHADRGRIYAAERVSDPPLSVRLVDAGALTAAELERGIIRLAGAEHLGRLFERVPGVDRDAVIATTGLITDECLAWLATQHVPAAEATPYRHHPAGIHRWEVPADAPLAPAPPTSGSPSAAPDAMSPFTAPAAPLAPPAPAVARLAPPTTGFAAPSGAPSRPLAPPAPSSAVPAPQVPLAPPPPPTTAPVLAGMPPLPRVEPDISDIGDDVITWDEPGFLDEPLPGDGRLLRPLALPTATDDDDVPPIGIDVARFGIDPTGDADDDTVDWIDRLGTLGLPLAGSDPLVRPAPLPPVRTEPADRFELIWPSGEVDEQFGGQAFETPGHPDHDRAGPTARLRLEGRGSRAAVLQPLAPPPPGADPAGIDRIEQFLAEQADADAAGRTTAPPAADDVVLAVRQAVASIEAGSLSPHERRTGPRVAGLQRAQADAAVTATGRMTRPNPAAGSVFDDVAPVAASSQPVLPPPDHDDEPADERVSALRRLIGSLRRR